MALLAQTQEVKAIAVSGTPAPASRGVAGPGMYSYWSMRKLPFVARLQQSRSFLSANSWQA